MDLYCLLTTILTDSGFHSLTEKTRNKIKVYLRTHYSFYSSSVESEQNTNASRTRETYEYIDSPSTTQETDFLESHKENKLPIVKITAINKTEEKTYQSQKNIKIEIDEIDDNLLCENNGTIKEESSNTNENKLFCLENNKVDTDVGERFSNLDVINNTKEKTYQSQKNIKIEIDEIDDNVFESIFTCENNDTIKEESSNTNKNKLFCLENNKVDTDVGDRFSNLNYFNSTKEKTYQCQENIKIEIDEIGDNIFESIFTCENNGRIKEEYSDKEKKKLLCSENNKFDTRLLYFDNLHNSKEKIYLSKKKKNLEPYFNIHDKRTLNEHTVLENSFTQTANLTQHMKTHTGDNPHECSVCKKSFSCSSNLNKHMRTHTGDKPYECPVCKKSFSRSSHLNEHMRTHTGEKPHKCSVCKKSFSRSSHLNEHIRTHTGEKPHKCSFCKESFSRSSYINKHMRIHTGEKPHECSVCKKSFSHASNLSKHMRTHR